MQRRHAAVAAAADRPTSSLYSSASSKVRWKREATARVDSLTGKCYDHRKPWIRDRLQALAWFFGVEIAAFAVLSNHVHVILRILPEVVAQSGRRFHCAVELADHLKAEAQRLGVNWLQGVRASQMSFAHASCP